MSVYLKLFETHEEYEAYINGGGGDTTERITLHS